MDSTGNSVINRFASSTFANVTAEYRGLFTPGLSLLAGVYDVFATQKGDAFTGRDGAHAYLQPYDGYHAPYPSGTTEYLMRINYQRAF